MSERQVTARSMMVLRRAAQAASAALLHQSRYLLIWLQHIRVGLPDAAISTILACITSSILPLLSARRTMTYIAMEPAHTQSAFGQPGRYARQVAAADWEVAIVAKF